jgi:hypothetical protein
LTPTQDGGLTVEEGLPMYGNIHISLTTEGDTSKASGLAVDRFPVADADGNLDHTRTFTFATSLGVDGIPVGATDAAICGMVMPLGGVETGRGTAPA